jgi:hypothetical protein
VLGFYKYPPFKTVGTCGIRPGGLPRWLKLLTKLAAILDLGTQSQLTRTPPPGQVEPPFRLPRRPICPKSTWGVERTASTRWISISVARSRPGRPRWTQVAFLEHPPGGVHLAKKSYRTYLVFPNYFWSSNRIDGHNRGMTRGI